MSICTLCVACRQCRSKNTISIFFIQCIIKQLLDSVFVISRIIKVSVRVISISLRLWVISPTSTLIILDILKTLSNNCLLFFSAVSVMEIKNLQRSEQALFLASRLCHSISRSCLCHAPLCFNLSLNILSNIKIF